MVFAYETSLQATSGRPQPTRVVVVGSRQLKSARSRAVGEKSVVQVVREEYSNERQNLHDKSLQWVKTWGNTVPGERRRRLEQVEDKKRQEEEERLRVDANWHAIQESEREAALKRAKELVLFASPTVRELNSAALLCDVIKERDMQIQLKAKRKNLKTLVEKMTVEEERKKLYEQDLAARDLELRKKMESARLLDEQKRMLEEKQVQKEKERKSAKADPGGLLLVPSIKKMETQTDSDVQKYHNAQKEYISDIVTSIEEKKKAKQRLQEQEFKLIDDCNAFNRRKDYIDAKRKEKEESDKQKRDAMIEATAKEQLLRREEDEKRRNEFLDSQFQKSSMTFFKREQEALEKRKREQMDINNFLHESSLKAAAEAKKHEEESTLVVAMIKKADEEANTQKIEKTRKAHKMAREVLDYNKKLIESRKKGIPKKQSVVDVYKQQDQAVDQYANELLGELNQQGINSEPLKVVISKHLKQTRKVPTSESNVVDHRESFRRLGFISYR